MPAIILREFICPGCGAREIRKTRQATLYCTRACWLKNRAGKYLRTGKEVQCPTCGKSHYIRGSSVKRGSKYCSKACDVTAKAVVPRSCKQCSAVFKPYGSRIVYCSGECRSRSLSVARRGAANTNWRGGVTKRMVATAATRAWTTAVFERDKFTCLVCGQRGGKLQAHHKDGYHWCKERRFDVSNGATLCKLCHQNFHAIYKTHNNTEIQWREFTTRRAAG